MAELQPLTSADFAAGLSPLCAGPSQSKIGPAPAKRLRLLALRPDVDVGVLRATNALSLETPEEIPEEFMCRICFEFLLGEIYQCSGGHNICKQCLLKSLGSNCATCAASMKGADGNHIRNRGLEQVLELLCMACPFQKKGCQETLPLAEVLKHMKECEFDENSIRMCEHFRDGENCQYRARCTNLGGVVKLLQHFKECHRAEAGRLPADGIFTVDFAELETDLEDVKSCLFLKADHDHLLISYGFTSDGYFTLVCIGIHQPAPPVAKKTAIKLRIKSQTVEAKDFCLEMPIVHILESEALLRDPPIRVRRSFLEKYYLNQEKMLSITVSFVWGNAGS